MDLKHLMNMREEISGLSGKRHRESDVSWLHGLDLLEQAAAGGYRHKPFLIRAGESFLIAIQHNRRNPDPYVGMAYLYLLTGDQARAIRYLNEAQRVAPSHDNSRLLLAAIVAGQEAAREQSTAVAGLEQHEIPEAEAFASDLPVLGPDQD